MFQFVDLQLSQHWTQVISFKIDWTINIYSLHVTVIYGKCVWHPWKNNQNMHSYVYGQEVDVSWRNGYRHWHSDTCSNPHQDCLHILYHLYTLKRYESIYSPSSDVKIEGQSTFFNLGLKNKLTSEFKHVKLRFKFDLCHILHVWRGM